MKIVDVTLAGIGVVDAPEEGDFDSTTDFVAELARAPVALVSIVEPEKDRQYSKRRGGCPSPGGANVKRLCRILSASMYTPAARS